MTQIALVTGGFDPIHAGHIQLITDAQLHGDEVWVGINSDEWLLKKKGFVFQPLSDRVAIVKALAGVSKVLTWDDSDGDASGAIFKAKQFGATHINFCNGGDRNEASLPATELMWSSRADCNFIYDVGGSEKVNSSSTIAENIKHPKTERGWGYYRVLHEVSGCKVKELTVDPGAKLSMQRHKSRAEFWLVSAGSAIINTIGTEKQPTILKLHNSTFIPAGMWHQLINPFPEPCRIVEIQYGSECTEDDIERFEE
jgi:cytidyltransferase-like protein